MYNIIIIGSGPAGHSAAVKAAELGKKVAVIEKAELGGICVNWGCIPTKALLKSAEVYSHAAKAESYGVEIVGEVRANLEKMVERSRGVSSAMSSGVGFMMKKHGIDVIVGEAKITDNHTVTVGEERYTAEHIIVATGARPRHLPSIPVDGVRVISSREALALTTMPSSMVVVGSGAIGLEFASFYSSLGVEVTIIEYLDRIAPLEDAEISATMERLFRKRKVKVMTSTTVLSVVAGEDKCTIEVDNKKKGAMTLEADVVLSAVGVEANIQGFGLEELGIETERGRIVVDKTTYKTNVEGIYAVGDIIATPALAHVAMAEAVVCVERICGQESHDVNYDLVPSCIYTFSEVASVGKTEEAARECYGEIKVGKFSMMASGKAAAVGDKDGLVKLVFRGDNDQLVGAHLVGHNVTEMVSALTLMCEKGITISDITNSIHAHPTISEGIMEAAAAL